MDYDNEPQVQENHRQVSNIVYDKKFPFLRGTVLGFDKNDGVYLVKWHNDGFIEKLPSWRVRHVTKSQ